MKYNQETHTPIEFFKIRLRVDSGKVITRFVKQISACGYYEVTNDGNIVHDVSVGVVQKRLIIALPEDIIWKRPARINKHYGTLEVVEL